MQGIADTSKTTHRESGRIVVGLAHLRLTLQASLIVALALLCALGFVTYSTFSANPVLGSGDAVVRWGLHDKRAMLSIYVMSLLFLAFVKFLSDASSPSHSPANGTMERRPGRLCDGPRTGWMRILWFFVGAALGPALYAEYIFSQVVRPDFHLDVHLGAMEAMYQGRIPFIETQTQYGPGNQLLLYGMMRLLDFSYWGALEAQAITNVAVLSLFAGLLTWFFGPVIGVAAILLLGVFVSPLFIAAFPGWGWLTRWFGVAASSLLLAEILFAKSRRRMRYAFLLGMFWGVCAFVSQENFTTGLLAFCLIFGLARGVRVVDFRESWYLAATVVGSGLLTGVALLTALVGPAHIASAITLYFDATSKVAAGVSNTSWSTPVGRSTIVEAVVYHASYFLMPGLMLLMVLYLAPGQTYLQRQRQKQVVGVVGAAAATTTLTLLRADIFHLYAPSFLLGALFLSCILVLPRTLAIGNAARFTLSGGFLTTLVGCIIITVAYGYPIGFSNPALSIGRFIAERWVQTRPPAQPSRALASAADPDLAFVLHRMIGDSGAPGDRLVTENYRKIIEIVAELRKTVGDRAIIFNDTGRRGGEVYVPTGLTYFLGGFRIVSSITEPRMSIWLESDYRRWQQDLANSDVDCLITTARDPDTDPMAMWFRSRYASSAKTSFQVVKQASFWLVCRE